MKAIRLDEDLWEDIKEELLDENNGKWNARLAQRAVQIYKREGGRYSSKVKKEDTSLHKWTEEEWDYVGEPQNSRYLPKKVREKLTPYQKKTENKRKGSRLGSKVPYSRSVKRLMKKEKIF